VTSVGIQSATRRPTAALTVECRARQAATANVTAGTGGRDTIWTRGNGFWRAAGFFYGGAAWAFLVPVTTAASRASATRLVLVAYQIR